MNPPACRIVLALTTAFCVSLGCDDPADDIPQAVLDQQARQAEAQKKLPAIPTTQDLLSGPRTVMALGPLPLTMRVPVSWKVEVAGPASHLRGRAPSGEEITIQLNSRAPMKRAELDAFVKSAKKEQAERPQSIVKADLRSFGDGQLFEWQKVGEPREWPVYEGVGSEMRTRTTTEQPFDWKITVLDPQGEAVQRYELSFIGLTKSQYDKDKAFLQELLDTLSSAGGAGAGGAGSNTSATTAPAGGSTSPAMLP